MIGQPKDYSEMLKPIFWSTLIVGIICSLSLGYLSPAIKKIIDISPIDWDLGPISLPLLAVALPAIVALIIRMFNFHNVISNIFKIREKFDVNQILLPLANGVNQKVDPDYLIKIRNNRHNLMRDTFYKYAPNVDKSVINSQYVATALDRWAWFWIIIEPTIILLLSALIAWWQSGFKYSLYYFGVMIGLILLAILIYPLCKMAAKIEVDDILNDTKRKNAIKEVFNAL